MLFCSFNMRQKDSFEILQLNFFNTYFIKGIYIYFFILSGVISKELIDLISGLLGEWGWVDVYIFYGWMNVGGGIFFMVVGEEIFFMDG